MTHAMQSPSSGPTGRVSGWLARREAMPTAVRAILRFHARTGDLDVTALRIRGLVEETLEGFLTDCYGAVEDALEAELGYEDVSFSYETKLTMPVELTLGYLYRRAIDRSPAWYDPVAGEVDDSLPTRLRGLVGGERDAAEHSTGRAEHELVQRAEAVARLCTEALLDGDMQDAINDDEYEDFRVDVAVDADERREIAAVAQSCLHERVEDAFAEFPDEVREEYDWAVEVSNRHQAEDEAFRDMLERARTGDESAVEEIKRRYRDAPVEESRTVLTAEERELPYSRSQYERVGVIYAGMVNMFRAAGVPIDDSFRRSVVLAIIGAQIWLDDIDDYEDDVADCQLTPVTAEYAIADSPDEAYRTVVSVTESYLDRAVECAVASGSNMTGIATEYIYLSGTPEVLPRGE